MRQGKTPASCYALLGVSKQFAGHVKSLLYCSVCHFDVLFQCSQQTGKGFPSLAQGYRCLLSTAWAQQLTSGLQLRPGYVPSQEGVPIKPSSAPLDSNAMVTHVFVPSATYAAALHVIQSIRCMHHQRCRWRVVCRFVIWQMSSWQLAHPFLP